MFSTEYIQQLKKLHGNPKKKKGFGGKLKELGNFEKYLVQWNPVTMLDYGCGKGAILSHLQTTYPQIKIEGYDPAVDMFSTLSANKYDCIFSNDVLEHIEPNHIDAVLKHINDIASKYIWLRIDTKPARKILSDGRNAHLIVEDINWWTNIITKHIQGNVVYKDQNDNMRIDFAIVK
jgi:2-polyprenyl-3-methyl-5-hydroxy-6-metoxy-1,4-benzoquinol methylase